MKFFTLFIVIVLALVIVAESARKFKRRNINPETLPSSSNSDAFFKPIRIKFIHGNESLTGKKSLFSEESFEKFMTKVINPVYNYFQQTIRVYQVPADNVPSKIMCEGLKKDAKDVSYSFNIDVAKDLKKYDYVFVVLFLDQSGNTASAANLSYMKVGGGYERPACGVIYINNNIHHNFLEWTAFYENERKRTFFHEMTHALAFAKAHYETKIKFINEKGTVVPTEDIVKSIKLPQYNIDHPFLVHPKIKQLTSEYFNCPTSNGYPLAAKDKSHFHQQVIANTIMRPQADGFVDRISMFMLALFEVSGWYKVDLSKAEKTLFGKGKGCDYLNLSCKDKSGNFFEEFCDIKSENDKNGCDFYYEAKSSCFSDPDNSDYRCNWMQPNESGRCELEYNQPKINSFNERYGTTSKCIDFRDKSNKRNGGCYEATCDDAKREITFMIGEKKITSTYKNGNKPDTESIKLKIGVKEYTFYFPQYERFCFNILNKQLDKGFKRKK